MKLAKENDQAIMKELEMSQILFNLLKIMCKGCMEQKDWENVTMSAILLIEICQPQVKDMIWMVKVIAMTK